MVLHRQDITEYLCQAWGKWLMKWQGTSKRYQGEAELLVEIIYQTAGLQHELLSNDPEYEQLFSLTNKVCYQLHFYRNQKIKVGDNGNCRTKINMTTPEIESDMQQLVGLVLEKSSDDTVSLIKQSFFTVGRSFYYATCCDPEVISHHINKLLFQRAI